MLHKSTVKRLGNNVSLVLMDEVDFYDGTFDWYASKNN